MANVWMTQLSRRERRRWAEAETCMIEAGSRKRVRLLGPSRDLDRIEAKALVQDCERRERLSGALLSHLSRRERNILSLDAYSCA